MKAFSTGLLLCVATLLQAQSVSLAPTFGNNGVRTISFPQGGDAYAHALRPDGKLLLAGYGYNINLNNYTVCLAVIDTVCGAADMTFGVDGVANAIHEQRTLCHNIALQPDGKIVGCGMVAPDNSGSQQWPGIFRFNADGSVDSTFNILGYARVPFNGTGSSNGSAGNLTAVFVNADSTILCTGAAFDGLIGAFRFNYDGSPDTSYGTAGAARMQLPNFTYSERGTGYLQADSTALVVTPMFNGSAIVIAMAKFDAFGEPDTTFGNMGLAVSNVTAQGNLLGISVQTDGRILVSSAGQDNVGFIMARFMPNGDLDPSYGSNGVSSVADPIGGANPQGRKMALLPDGTTLQFGWVDSQYGTCLKRDVDGNVVTGFGANGYAHANTGAGNERFWGGLQLPSGDFFGYGGKFPNDPFLVVKFTIDPALNALPVISIAGTDLVCTGTGDLQWFLDGVLINGATTNTFTPTQNGDYTVTMTVSADCEFTSDPYTLLNVGVSELAGSPIHIANNPVSDMLVVLNNGGVVRYEVLGIEGQRISTGQLHGGRNEIDMNSTSSGVYFLRTETKGSIATQRIIKQ